MEAARNPGISLVLPVANQAATIRQAICDAAAALARLSDDYEIVVVDAGSGDGTADIVQEEAAKIPAVRLIRRAQVDYGASLRAGFCAATRPLVGYADASGQYDFRQLDRLLILLGDHDIACGYRLEQPASLRMRIYLWLYNLLARLLLRTGSRDCTCAFKLMRRSMLDSLSLEADDDLIHVELLAQARLDGLSVVEVGVMNRPDSAGKQKLSVVAMFLSLAAVLRYWWSAIQFPARDSESGNLPQASPLLGLRSAAVGLAVLLLIATPVLFLNLSYPLLEPDENRVAQIGMEMFHSGDYVLPTRHGRPYLIKPPLLFWLISASFSLWGVSEWSARLPVALAALVTVLATFLLGCKVVGRRAAWLGAVTLLLSGGFVLAGRFLLMDAVLTMFTTTGLLAVHAGATSTHRRAFWWLLAGVACGLGILVKGPVALVLIGPPLVAACWLARNSFSAKWREWLLFAGTALALAAPWYVIVSLRQGDFLGEFIWKHNIQRYTNAFDHQQPWWFYLPVLCLGMLPASLLLPALGVFLASQSAEIRRLRTPGLGFLALAAGWIILFFSLSSSKLPTYILPAIPLLCLMLGRLLDALLLAVRELSDSGKAGRFAAKNFLPRSAFGLGLVGIAAVAADALLGSDTLGGYLIAGIVAAVSLILLIATLRRTFPPSIQSWSLITAAALALLTFIFNDVYPEAALRRSNLLRVAPEVAAARHRSRRDGIPVAFYGALGESASLYMDDQDVHKFAKDDRDLLLTFAQEHPMILLLANSSNAGMVERNLPPGYQMQRHPGSHFLFELTDRRSPAERSLARHRDGEMR